jgi:hypothetical protein
MPDRSESAPKRSGHLWAVAVPLLMIGSAGLVGLLLLDVLGAGYLSAIFGRLL